MKKQIIWEHYTYEFLENENKFVLNKPEDEPSTEYQDAEENSLEGQLEKLDKVVQAPFGIFQVDDAMNPFKQFKMWMGHTNFDLNAETVDIIEDTPGVEVLHILSRYRFIVAIGAAFDTQNVKYNITKLLCEEKENIPLIEEKLSQLKESLKIYPKWTIYVYPNGNITHTFLRADESNLDEFNYYDNLYHESSKLSNGILLTHESK